MIRPFVCGSAVSVAVMLAAACGGSQTPTPSPSAAPAASAPAAAAKPAAPATISLLEPIEGAMAGHIDTFRWSPVAGADGYVIKIVAVTGDRVVWESQPMTTTETKLPATVALEPEVHTWSVSARKGTEVLAVSPTQKFTITP
jgi:hypothetical protein